MILYLSKLVKTQKTTSLLFYNFFFEANKLSFSIWINIDNSGEQYFRIISRYVFRLTVDRSEKLKKNVHFCWINLWQKNDIWRIQIVKLNVIYFHLAIISNQIRGMKCNLDICFGVFQDCLCQMLDMVKPKCPGKIALSDLKRCKLTSIFFDTFFNLEKYLDHEQRDPFASQREHDFEGEEVSLINSFFLC